MWGGPSLNPRVTLEAAAGGTQQLPGENMEPGHGLWGPDWVRAFRHGASVVGAGLGDRQPVPTPNVCSSPRGPVGRAGSKIHF